jgi:hypothetical protein
MITKTLHTLALASAFPTFSSSSISLIDTSDNASSGQSKNLPTTHPRKFSKTYTTYYTQYQLHSIFFKKNLRKYSHSFSVTSPHGIKFPFKSQRKKLPFTDDWWTEFILSGLSVWRHEVSQKRERERERERVCVCVFCGCAHTPVNGRAIDKAREHHQAAIEIL